MRDFLFATYASHEYIPYLENCVSGCAKLMKDRPVVFAFDSETADAARTLGCDVEEIPEWTMERHLYSLEILRLSSYKWTVLIDADCWPLKPIDLARRISEMEEHRLDFMGDVGQLDLEYLFKTTSREDMLLRVHDVLRTFPHFSSVWEHSENIAPARSAYGKIVVDQPLLYGGFGIYRTSAFRGMNYPSWIHSADIWISMFAIEQGIKWRRSGAFQFNHEIASEEEFVHFSGVKDHSLVSTGNQYSILLKGTDCEVAS